MTLSETFQFFAAPFAMCVILAGIHCYLGLHVLARGVIFVDLSLAQVAAFGATVAILLGYEHRSTEEYVISLCSTLIVAALFALARRHEKTFSQEAIIGIVYALASAATVLVVDRMAHGAEHIKDVLVGQVLWVTWSDVFKTATIYFGVGALHYVFRGPLLAASFGSRASDTVKWDFVFYALFGVVITSSVSVAGVLQVFSYLIVPALVSSLISKNIRTRLIFGWIFGTAFSFIGLLLSHHFDLPAGATLVVLLALVPVAALVFKSQKT